MTAQIHTTRFAALCVALALAPDAALAQAILVEPASPGAAVAAEPPPDAAKGIWDRANLLGDWGGVRTRLAEHGVSFGLTEVGEVFGNASGGVRRGVAYEGLTQMGMGIDTEKAFGLAGGIFNITAYQIHGRGLSQNMLGNNLQTVSSIEAQRGTLLFELWYEQTILNKSVSLRVGQLAADQEFLISTNANLFINHTFGWPTLPSADLPAGGPAYPLATPGVRLRYTPTDGLAVLAAVFNGDPAGQGAGTPQDRNPSGTAFRMQDGVFAIMEMQLGVNQGAGAAGLPGTYKLGGSWSSTRFADQRLTAAGLSLADPTAVGAAPRGRRGDFMVYGVADQLVYRPAGKSDGGVGVFGRVAGAPGDRNLVSFYVDGGVTYKGVYEGRDDDTAGIALSYARISDAAAKLDAEAARFSGVARPIRRHETVLELTYQAVIAPWLQVQPTAQYLFNLSGGVVNPVNPAKRLGDAAVFGLRTNVTF